MPFSPHLPLLHACTDLIRIGRRVGNLHKAHISVRVWGFEFGGGVVKLPSHWTTCTLKSESTQDRSYLAQNQLYMFLCMQASNYQTTTNYEFAVCRMLQIGQYVFCLARLHTMCFVCAKKVLVM